MKGKDFKVSEVEKTILKALPQQYKYIARDRYEGLYAHEYKPDKSSFVDEWGNVGEVGNLNVYSYGFDYITWENEEPTLISDLINS